MNVVTVAVAEVVVVVADVSAALMIGNVHQVVGAVIVIEAVVVEVGVVDLVAVADLVVVMPVEEEIEEDMVAGVVKSLMRNGNVKNASCSETLLKKPRREVESILISMKPFLSRSVAKTAQHLCPLSMNSHLLRH